MTINVNLLTREGMDSPNLVKRNFINQILTELILKVSFNKEKVTPLLKGFLLIFENVKSARSMDMKHSSAGIISTVERKVSMVLIYSVYIVNLIE